MKNILKIFIIVLFLTVISIFLYITGKKHEAILENNYFQTVKYSINGEPYKTLDSNKKAKIFYKGISSVIFIKIENGKVLEKDLNSKNEIININDLINDK